MDDPTPSHAHDLLRLLGGKCQVQAVSTVASLKIPDRLAVAPRSAEQLAGELGCEADGLERLLRVVAGLGFLERSVDGVYALTAYGEQLRSDALGPLAAFVGSPEQWDPWSRLRETLRDGSGRTPFATSQGAELYDFLDRDSAARERYDLAIDAFTGAELEELCEVHDFSEVQTLVDVGGGRGRLLREVLTRNPGLRGVLLDRPDVVERARGDLLAGLDGRVELSGGDFFEDLPGGHDVYCLRHVVHNWDDARAERLLRACRDAMTDRGRVLVIEMILSPDERLDTARLLDLEMTVLVGGRVRRKPELRRLFRRSGLRLEAVRRVGESWLLVGARADEADREVDPR